MPLPNPASIPDVSDPGNCALRARLALVSDDQGSGCDARGLSAAPRNGGLKARIVLRARPN